MKKVNKRYLEKKRKQKNIIFLVLTFFMLILAIKGLVVVSEYVGYATFAGEAGNIYELVIKHIIPTEDWAGIYGVAVRVDGYNNQQYEDIKAVDMEEVNLLFQCLEPDIEHEVYATTAPNSELDLSTLYPATPQELDDYKGKNYSDFDSATNTYTTSYTFNYGSQSITAPAVYTYKINEGVPTTFVTGILKDGNNNFIHFAIVTNFTEGFNGRIYNFQFLLPAWLTDRRYYFFTDPSDQCPEGEGENPNVGHVYGVVTSTTGSPISEAIVDVGGFTALTNEQGEYNLTVYAGNYNIFGIKEGYNIYQNNVSVLVANYTEHNIVLELKQEQTPYTGIGPGVDAPGDNVDIGSAIQEGVGPGEDVGPGEAPLVPVVETPEVIEGKDYLVGLAKLNRKLRIGQFLQEKITIYSLKKNPGFVSLSINGTGLDNLITVDKDQLTINSNEQGEFILTVYGREPTGIFNGTIYLDGDFNATIPVEIEVLPKQQLPVQALQIDLEMAEKTMYPGDLARFKADLRNLITDQQYPVELFFTVQNPEGTETIWSYSTSVYIKTAFSLLKNFKLPNQLSSGDYILRVSARYLDFSSSSSTMFHIAVPFWQRIVLGLRMWAWFLILLAIAGIAVAVVMIRRNIESKKKFHLKVEMDELPKPGPRSVYVGKIAETDHMTYFGLENFKVHTIVAGSTGGGKSVSAQVVIEEALEKGVAVIAFDPTAQWTGMLRPCKDKMMLSLYPLFGMKKTDAKAYPGNIRMIKDAREYIDIQKYVKPGEIQVFCFHKLDPKDMDIVVANAIRSIFRSGPQENKLLKVMFVFDEVHRLLPKFGGSGDGFLQIERACREFRKWGMGVMLISQVLSDFVGTIKANINTEIQMRTRDEGDLERIRQKYGEDVLRSLVKATVGSGMVENPAYNRGKPYFIAFKPLKHSTERMNDEEIEQYNDYNDKIDNLYYSLDQLEKEGIDVFDLKLELKLALDKVKSGNFNMVKIYLEGLTPRIDKNWQKLGKQPKQLERELVDLDALKEDMDKAKQERDKYVATQNANKPKAEAAEKKGLDFKADVPPEHILNLSNGMIVNSLSSLYDEVSAMKDDDLVKEFDPENQLNKFADWASKAINDQAFTNNLYNCKTKEDMIALLEKVKAGTELENVKAPDWVLKKQQAAVKKEEVKKQVEEFEKTTDAPSTPNQEVAQEQAPAKQAPVKQAPTQAPPAQQQVPPAQEQSGQSQVEQAPQEQASSEQASVQTEPPQKSAMDIINEQYAAQGQAQEQAQPITQTEQPPAQQVQENQPQEKQPEQNNQVTQNTQENQNQNQNQNDAQAGVLPSKNPQEQQAAAVNQQAIPVQETTPVQAQEKQQPEQPPQQVQQQPPVQAPAEQPVEQAPVQQQKPSLNLEALVAQKPEEYFRLENGMELRGVKELKDYIPNMDEQIFNNHVGPNYNHFAEWIRGVFHNEDLANKLANSHSKDEMMRVLS